MLIEPRPRHERFTGLSCYTANLAAYLDTEMSDVDEYLAGSIRLAVRTDLPSGRLAFSHHHRPLEKLPDGTRLSYATLPPRAALVGIADELRRRGRVLVVTEGSRLPWSPARHEARRAPHWLLVTGRRAESWHVVDAFAGLLAGGEQRPYTGWLSTARLIDAMTEAASSGWSTEQHQRNSLAFGFPVAVPESAGPLWLRRDLDTGPSQPELPGSWLTDDDQVLPFLADYFTDPRQDSSRYLDDLWTAAAHRVFRYQWLRTRPDLPDAVRERALAAGAAWLRLPGALRFAVDSARRGRPRPSLVHQTLRHLLDVDPDSDQLISAPRRESR